MNNVLKRKILFVVVVGTFSIIFQKIYNYFFKDNLIIETLIFIIVASISYKYIIYKKI